MFMLLSLVQLYWFVVFACIVTALTVWLLRLLKLRPRVITAIAILELPFLMFLPTLVNLVGNGEQCLSRRGRVVDVETMKGLPGVLVSLKADYGKSGALFNLDARTDKDGYYEYPSQLRRLHMWWPPSLGSEPHTYVSLHAIAPGYVNIDDVYSGSFAPSTSWPPGAPLYWPKLSTPDAHFNGRGLDMTQISMRRQHLELESFLIYFASLKENVAGTDAASSVLGALHEEAIDRVCAQPPDALVGYFVYEGLSKLSKSRAGFIDRMNVLEPANTKFDLRGDISKQKYERKYEMGHVCDALMYTRGAL